MKKFLFSFAAITMMFGLYSCGGGTAQTVVQNTPVPVPQATPSNNPFGGETYTMPTFEPDTEEYFAASGIATGPRQRMNVLQQNALTNAQSMIRQKMQHAYEGMISDYASSIGINNKSDIADKVERAGNQTIKVVVNETMARDVKFSGVDEKGNVTCFVGIRVYKKQLADKLADQVSNDEELKVRFNEEQYRKYIQEKLKEYKENQK